MVKRTSGKMWKCLWCLMKKIWMDDMLELQHCMTYQQAERQGRQPKAWGRAGGVRRAARQEAEMWGRQLRCEADRICDGGNTALYDPCDGTTASPTSWEARQAARGGQPRREVGSRDVRATGTRRPLAAGGRNWRRRRAETGWRRRWSGQLKAGAETETGLTS